MRAGQLDVCRLLVSAGCPLPGWPDRKDALGDLAATAARGGHERVLLWMESEPGLAFGPAEPFDRRKTHYGLVSAAAEGGHVELMELLDQQQAGGNTAGPQLYNLESIAYGCTLEVLQRYWALWVEGQGWTGGPGPYGIGGDGVPPLPVGGGGTGRLLAAAGASPTPDWAAKLDFIRSKRPGDSFDWIHNWNAARRATLLPDLLPRLLHLAAVGVDFEFECDLDAACVAAAGHADALAYLLDNTSQTVNERVVDKALTGCGDGDAGRQLQTLHLLAARGCVFGPGHVAMAGAAGAAAGVLRWLAESVPDTAVARDGAAGAAGAVAAAGEAGTGAAEGEVVMSETDAWSAAFTAAAKGGGADLPLLRYLHEVRGAAVDLVAVAAAGSEEALDWAAAELKRAGQPLPVWTAEQAWELGASGNRIALDWVLRSGLGPAWPDAAYTMEARFRFPAVQAWLEQGGATDRLDDEGWQRVVQEGMRVPGSDKRRDAWSPWQRRWLADRYLGAARARGGAAAEAKAARVLADVGLAAAAGGVRS